MISVKLFSEYAPSYCPIPVLTLHFSLVDGSCKVASKEYIAMRLEANSEECIAMKSKLVSGRRLSIGPSSVFASVFLSSVDSVQ